MTAVKLQFLYSENSIHMDEKLFHEYSILIYSLTGIYLEFSDKNISLIENRLNKLMRRYNIGDYESLYDFLKQNLYNNDINNSFVSAVTTNKTDFFREKHHYDLLLADVKKRLETKEEVFIWSAACSIGSEPYSIAIYLKENLTPTDFNKVKILATDIDLECLKTATQGIYESAQLSGLENHMVEKYFNEIGGLYLIDEELKSKIHFSQLNLKNIPYPINRSFDLIFCRNVFIYFSSEDRNQIATELAKNLVSNGKLYLGTTEIGSIKVKELVLNQDSEYVRSTP